MVSAGFAALLLATTVAVATPFASPVVEAAPTIVGSISGGGFATKTGVFRDIDADGLWDAGEPGQPGIEVRAVCVADTGVSPLSTDDTYVSFGPVTTAENGSYTLATQGSCRVEFAIGALYADFLQPGVATNALVAPNYAGSFIQFINTTVANTTVTTSVINPAEYTGPTSTPQVVVGRNLTGATAAAANPATPTFDNIYTMNYDFSGLTAKSQYDEMGAIWGLAIQPSTKTIFASAVAKRHAGLGAGGIDGIYAIGDPDGAADWTVPFTGVDTDTANVIGTDAARGLGDFNDPSNDDALFTAVGKVGWGDMDISEDGRTLYAVNIQSNTLVAITIADKSFQSFNIPNPACVNGFWRPFGLEVNDGIVYVGGVCDALTSGAAVDLAAHVFAYNPTGAALPLAGAPTGLSPATWSANLIEEATPGLAGMQLTYAKGCTISGSATGCTWNAWDDTYTNAEFNNPAWAAVKPQPMLTDLEIDDDGGLILAFGDRTGFQFGYRNRRPTGADPRPATIESVTGGDLLRAAPPTGAGTTFTLEGAGVVAKGGRLGGGSITGNTSNNQGPGGGEVYPFDAFVNGGSPLHEETGLGALAKAAGRRDFLMNTMDPLDTDSNGVRRYPTDPNAPPQTAASLPAIELYDSTPADCTKYTPPSGPAVCISGFGKGSGLADLELITEMAPIEVGNRVWRDDNRNGIQDAGEPGIGGVTVSLIIGGVTQTAVTTAAGEYLFSSRADRAGATQHLGLDPANYRFESGDDTATLRIVNASGGSQQAGLAGLFPTEANDATPNGANVSGNNSNDSDGTINGTSVEVIFTLGDLGADGDTAQYVASDSNATPGDAVRREGYNRHIFDFGFSPRVSVGNRVWFDTDNDSTLDAGEQPIPNVRVALLFDLNNDGAITGAELTPIAYDTTDAAGLYLFDQYTDSSGTPLATPQVMMPGNYQVVVLPTNFAALGVLDSYWSSGTTMTANGTTSETAAADPDNDLNSDDNGDATALAPFVGGVISKIVTVTAGGEPVGEEVGVLDNNTNAIVYDNSSNLSVDFGFYKLSFGNIVWMDNGAGAGNPDDGILSGSETGVGGIHVRLYSNNGTQILVGADGVLGTADDGPADVLTDVNGFYAFSGLPAGTYSVKIDAPVGYRSSSDPANVGSPLAADDDDNGVGVGVGVISSATFTLVAGAVTNGHVPNNLTGITNNPRVDFGLYTPPVSVGNQVWRDTNNNGVIDTAEVTIPGVRVELFFDRNGDNTIGGAELTPIAVAVTDADGLYLFDRETDTAGVASVIPTLLAAGQYRIGIAASNFATGGPLELLYSSGTIRNGDGSVTESVIGADDHTDNDDNGVRALTGPFAGFVMSDLIQLSAGGELPNEVAAIGGTPYNNDDALVPDRNSDLTLDFGFYSFAVGDYVWIDLDRDGLQDLTEAPLAAVTVNLLNADGSPALNSAGTPWTTTTDANGLYLFDGLEQSNYIVEFVRPAGYVFTVRDSAVATDLTDSDALPATGRTAVFALSSASPRIISGYAGLDFAQLIDPTLDAGFVPVVAVGDFTWYDANHNGLQDPSEVVLDGVTVTLQMPDGLGGWTRAKDVDGVDVPDTVTGALAADTGYYVFDNLFPDTYRIVFTLPANSSFTIQEVGADVEIDSNPDSTTGITPQFTLNPTLNPQMRPTAADLGVTKAFYIDPSIDAGVWQPMALGDYTWVDANGNGAQDVGEPALKDVTVELLQSDGLGGWVPATDADGVAVASQLTDINGHYVFDNLLAGRYQVQFTLPAGYLFTSTGGGTPATDSNPNASTGRTSTISLVPSSTNVRPVAPGDGTSIATLIDPTIDAGVILLVAVGDYTWIDTNRNGVQNAGEPALANVTVRLYLADGVTPASDALGNVVPPAVTDVGGHYFFDNLLPGSYVMSFQIPSGYVFTSTGAGSAATDSNPIAGATPTLGVTPVFTIAASVAGDTVADTDSATSALFVNPTIDAGVVPTVAVGDYTWIDSNADGVQNIGELPLQNVRVTLLNPDGSPAVDAQGTAVAPVLTDANGFYLIDNLLPGDYQIQFDLPTGWAFTTQSSSGSTGGNDSNPSIATGRTPTFTIASTATGDTIPVGVLLTSSRFVNPTIDAGVVPLVAIGDYTWLDNDNDGVQDAGEPALPGVTVRLLTAAGAPAVDAKGNPVAAVITDSAGHYVFDNLRAGTYTVSFTGPASYLTTITGGGSSSEDSNPGPTGVTPPFTVCACVGGDTVADTSAGTVAVFINPTIDAGYFQSAGIGDRVWFDTNSNGIQDPGERGVPNVTVRLYDHLGAFAGMTTTDTSGFYQFLGLVPGDYSVEFTNLPAGYAVSPRDQGPDDAADSDADSTTLRTIFTTLSPGEYDPTWDLGISQPAVQPPPPSMPSMPSLPVTGSDSLTTLQFAAWSVVSGLALLLSFRRRRRNCRI